MLPQRLAEALVLYAAVLGFASRFRKALEVLGEARDLVEPSRHGWILATHDMLAVWNLLSLGRLDDAEPVARSSLGRFDSAAAGGPQDGNGLLAFIEAPLGWRTCPRSSRAIPARFASSSARRVPSAPSASPSQCAPSAKSPLMNHSHAIPDASDSAASASAAAMCQSSAARKLPDSDVMRSRHTGPVTPRRPSRACSAICR